MMGCELLIEVPVNGGRNYNGPKVNDSLALVKPNYMRETPPKLLGTRRGIAAVKIRKTWGQSAGKAWYAPGTLRDFTFGSVS